MEEFDNHDLRPTFLAPSAGEKEQVILAELFIRTGAENSTMKQWHGTAKALLPAVAFPISGQEGRLHQGRLEAVTLWRGS